MTLLDEKIAALFRKNSPISASAEPTTPVDRPIVEKAAFEAVVSSPRSKRQMQRGSTTNLRRLPKGLWQSNQAQYGRDWI